MSLKRTIKKMCLVSIILSSFQCVNISFFGLSLFEISSIITILLAMLYYIINKTVIKKGIYLYYSMLIIISSLLSWTISTNRTWANSYILLSILIAMFVFVIVNFFDVQDFRLLLKFLIYSQIITIIFSVFTYYHYYFGNGIHENMNFFGVQLVIDNEMVLRMQASSQVRFTLPYATPPQLSVVMAICIYILYKVEDLFPKYLRYFFLCSFVLILIFTGSRTGIYALIATLIITHLKIKKIKLTKKKIFYFIFSTILFSVCLIYISNLTYVTKMISRFSIENLFEDRHFLVPLDGLIIWLSNIKNFILGIGFGSSINMIGAHTYLPAYFLNSYITIIVERGLLGIFIVLILIGNLFVYNRFSKKTDIRIYVAVVGTYLIVLISYLFYEIQYNYFVIFVIAISFKLYEVSNKNF